LFALGTVRVFSNVLAGDYVLDYLEGKRHYEITGTSNRKITALLLLLLLLLLSQDKMASLGLVLGPRR
jgi:hypothetical protein